jgi:phosphopantothenoylcysteine decarboxylase/phosphopantothenate--cysteine ligase
VLKGRRVVVGVTGGIAAYKAADLVSKLVAAGAEVRAVMTESARRFVTDLTFRSLSGFPVAVDTFDRSIGDYPHLALAEWGEVMVVAPATANIIGKAAGGIADEVLSTALLSFSGPVLFAPAMNSRMWGHPAVRDNVKRLRARGAGFVGPGRGRLACGESGVGRMAEVPEILAALKKLLPRRPAGKSKKQTRRRRS